MSRQKKDPTLAQSSLISCFRGYETVPREILLEVNLAYYFQ